MYKMVKGGNEKIIAELVVTNIIANGDQLHVRRSCQKKKKGKEKKNSSSLNVALGGPPEWQPTEHYEPEGGDSFS